MKHIRYFFEYVFLSILLLLSSLFPVQISSNFGGWIGRTIGPKLAASRKALNNIKHAFPEKSEAERQKILIGMWDNLGRTIMEYPHLQHIARDRTEIIGLENIKDHTTKSKNAAVVFAAHLGNWEIPPPAMFINGNVKSSPIYRAPNNPYVDKVLKKARSLGGRLKSFPKSTAGSRQMIQALKNGENIGILIDQKYNEGISSNFFGRPAMTSPAFIQLAQKFNCPLIPLRSERIVGATFRVTIYPELTKDNKSVEELLNETHSMLEHWITERPEQWLWLHRRWDSVRMKEKLNKEEQNNDNKK